MPATFDRQLPSGVSGTKGVTAGPSGVSMKVYVSSTSEDLADHREQVNRIVRQSGHEAVAMEDYVATGRPPLDKCLQDVADCDVYVGLFAWRYGYIPRQDNPHRAGGPQSRGTRQGHTDLPHP